ncbi:hypothetical protein AVEN_1622-1 [Araneus ventricosus]|uniref:Transposase Tc1-like domain-containing protein n=1 Tax=Araneus ventricosus TaxID=182803 RepID=A0A4Y2Q747_ARAVE|nr:hypothetical protein AVEN_1622-1 [Araneus ventricosus]
MSNSRSLSLLRGSMARALATDLTVSNYNIQQHQNGILQLQIGRTFCLTQSTVCSIIKRFTTTVNSRPGKALCRKLSLTDWEVRLFRRHIHKNKYMAVTDLSRGQDKVLERPFPKHVRVDISKVVATHSTMRDVNHFSLHRINTGVGQISPHLNSISVEKGTVDKRIHI